MSRNRLSCLARARRGAAGPEGEGKRERERDCRNGTSALPLPFPYPSLCLFFSTVKGQGVHAALRITVQRSS